jgi:hypothetical protein
MTNIELDVVRFRSSGLHHQERPKKHVWYTEEQDQACLAGTTTLQNNEQGQLLLVAWLSGIEIAYERNMQHEKERTSRCSEQEQHHEWSQMGQGMMRRRS